MSRLLAVLVIACSLNIVWLAPRAHAAASPAVPTVRVILQLKGQPIAADPNLRDRSQWTHWRYHIDTALASTRWYTSAIRRYQDAEAAYLQAHGASIQVKRHLSVLFNGLAVTVPASQINQLRRDPNILAVIPDQKVYPQLDRSMPLIHVPAAWSVLGGQAKAGKGVYIADIDTGIDPKNPCFNPAGFPTPPVGIRSDTTANMAYTSNKIVVAKAFGPDENGHYSAADTFGHGTFTASIEACDANTPTPLGTVVSGAAPDAYLMNYNVFPDTTQDPNGFNDTIAAALDQAVLDGADVANMSLGIPFQVGDPSLDFDVLRTDLATIAGTLVVVSAGNAGPTAQSVSSPGTAPLAISVGATTNSRDVETNVEISGAGLPADLQKLPSSQGSHPFNTLQGPLPMVYVGLGRRPGNDTDNPKADDFAGKDVSGKIAVIDRGILLFQTKLENAAAAGAKAVILVDNRDEVGIPSFSVGTATLPVMMVSQKAGQELEAWIQNHPTTTATLDPNKVQVEETPNYLSDFSARGYGPDYSVKPDLVAPGQFIYAATENSVPSGEMYDPSGFTESEGTSFSAPHVTGVAALLIQKHLGQQGWTPESLKAVIMETATMGAVNMTDGSTPTVMDVGAGLVNADAAVTAGADLIPYSVSLGQVNVTAGAVNRSQTLTLNDLGGGSGTWSASVQTLHGAPGFSVSVPPSVQLASGGHSSINVQFSTAANTPAGDYDGYIVLTQLGQTLHVPFFAHVMSKAVTPGTVLLVDDTTSRYQSDPSLPPIVHVDVSKYFEDALDAIHRPYTYWDEAQLGPPALADMQKASAVLYFTGRNLNAYVHENRDFQAMLGPLNTIDVTNMHSYLLAGGKVFVTGLAASLSDLTWTLVVMGANVAGLSTYDNDTNDKTAIGGLSPPNPSAVPDTRKATSNNSWLFKGMKLDLSTTGDGAKDNVAVESDAAAQTFGNTNSSESLVGVTGLEPFVYKGDSFYPAAFGKAVLQNVDLPHSDGADVGIVNSDDPTLKHTPSYKGRSVLFSFDFAGINDSNGSATRAQVLQKVFSWLDDKATVTVAAAKYHPGQTTTLRASVPSSAGVQVVQYVWQVGSTTLKATTKPTKYKFPRAGSYRLRVQITDSLGHTEVSAWKTVTVR